MKKIILFGLMLVMGFVLGLASVNATYVYPCGPSIEPPWCVTKTNCGARECTAVYKAIDVPASITCKQDWAECASPEVDPTGCSKEPPIPKFTCSSETGGTHTSCAVPTCIQPCQAQTASVYDGREAKATGAATSFYTNLITSGVFGDIVPCSEINSCMQKVAVSALKSYDRLTCGGIEQSTYERIIGDSAVNKAALEQVLPQIATRQEVLGALQSTGYQFASPEQLAQYITNCASACSKDILNTIANQQTWSVLANKAVDAARVAAGIELSFFNEIGVIGTKLFNSVYGTVKSVMDSAIAKIANFAKTVWDFAKSLFGGSGGSEQAASDAAGTADAQNAIQDAENSKADGKAKQVNCGEHRAVNCVNEDNCVLDTREGALQCLAALPGGKDRPVTVTFGSIHVIDNRMNNMYTLTGKENQGVVYQKDGFVNIDKGGTTKISVAGTGAFITDVNNNQLYIGSGTTFYFGDRTKDEDTYLTNTMVLDYDSKIAVKDVNDKEQRRYIVSQKNKGFKQDIELAVTLNHRDLQGYKNAVNIVKSKDFYELITRGFSDILLLEEDEVFPLVTRNFAKGDALIIKFRNVKIPYTYIVDDENYQYTIEAIGDSTKVTTRSGKIIQDSGSLNTRLSRRQNILVNNI